MIFKETCQMAFRLTFQMSNELTSTGCIFTLPASHLYRFHFKLLLFSPLFLFFTSTLKFTGDQQDQTRTADNRR